MKFGVFYEHQLPRPWTDTSELDLLQESLDQVELADQLGYDYCWEVEHHFLEEYSHSSAPEVFLGAVSQRTKRIRLGHGIMQLTTNQPHRVAEKVATLDLLSRGRVELGMGEGGGPAELHPFGVQVRSKRDRWIEAVKAIIPMFSRTAWEFHGDFYDFPARNVVPKPIPKPHPPLWVACTNVKTIAQAAEWGMGALGFSFVDATAAQAWVNKYYNTFRTRQYEAAHVDQVILLNQAGKTTHGDICDSLKLFADEVMPEFRDRHSEHEAWKQDVLGGRIMLDALDTDSHDLYAYQTRDVMANKLSAEQIRERMLAKAAK